ncbi:RNA polymerase sigma factor, sigma-70 family protein [Mycobacterium intracellulare 1956]|uniref:RNA polymerase sigma factor, sigma-70 family protein n=1 Tax=Mycobacterium intracellulare 1956 TaxID=1299331 RepID=X8CU72_MYCIT|nr:RNA polymerase sigma factor, sigma-70 family protein [Mycobacterium intracellulare 1956]
MSDVVRDFESQRPRLFGLAYRLLGSASEAEDAVQDAYLRLHRADAEAIESLPAWLTTAVTNLCLTRLTSARARREVYPGPWLPEPVLTDDRTLGPLETAEQRESVSIALLSLMERLGPTERAAFVLREAFAYSHFEIAEILETSEANARQLYRRARQRLGEPRRRFQPDRAQWRRLVERFFTAARAGDVDGLVEILTDTVTSTADGGGKVAAAGASSRAAIGRPAMWRACSAGTWRRRVRVSTSPRSTASPRCWRSTATRWPASCASTSPGTR